MPTQHSSAPCPMCKKPAIKAYRPFCSDRCSKLDLARWFGEHYVLAGNTPLEGMRDSTEDLDRDND